MTSGKQLWKVLWNDEAGTVLSAELVLVGTLGVIGATAGVAAVGHSVNGELEEVAYSLRSLDQSYHLEGHRGCRAWTAGSSYTQRSVEESHDELQQVIERHRRDEETDRDDGDHREERVEPRRDRDEERDERNDRRRERDAEDDAERWDGDDRRRDADADGRDDEPRRERDDDDDRSARDDDDRRRDSERDEDDRKDNDRDDDDRSRSRDGDGDDR